ncbi:tRNA 2'-phosphotransferase 1-like protein [Powellomyces hirtus]|nr:tRNA 2'-phosphotransferase 1-like protein [Powellomyces hirtus]
MSQLPTSITDRPTSSSRGRRGGGGRGRGRPDDSPTVKVSKALSYVLRHGAEKVNIPIRSDGYVLVSDLAKHPPLRNVSLADIQKIVASNEKQRFALREEPRVGTAGTVWLIRANQGHSVQVSIEMHQILTATEAPVVIHGTFLPSWGTICQQGLKPMTRQHIHFAAGLPGKDAGVISGMRKSCDVYIYIDMPKALASGIPFFRSANNVILSPGNERGVILPEFFAKVEDAQGNLLK